MKALNKLKKHGHSLLFVTWLISTVTAGIYFVQARLIWFDPQGVLNEVTSDALIALLAEQPELNTQDLSNSLVHFISEPCQCSLLSENHKAELTRKAEQLGLKVLTVRIGSEFKSIIPSTPAALIVGEHRQLVYFGPYSVGLACASENSLINNTLQNFELGFNSQLIENQARGCFCNL